MHLAPTAPTARLLPLFLLPLACQSAGDAPPPPTPASLVAELAPRALALNGYGGYAREVRGANATAQGWFNEGLQLVYGFNHNAGVQCFAAAAEADPECAMAWWGIAYGYGIDVNNTQVADQEAAAAHAAAQAALALADRATPTEQALIHAVAERAVFPLPADRKPLDEAYALAMADAWQRFPEDPDVGALFAEALMNLQPWDYWTADGASVKRADEIVSVLESVLAQHPEHPGANHFYIHAVEASGDVQRAVASAERLERLVPGSGHLVHMPSHIYINVGRYQDAVASNLVAIEADQAFFAQTGDPGFYSIYYIHNIHFLAYAAMMSGQSQLAIESTRRMEAEVPPPFLEQVPEFADGLMPAKFHALIRFGRWQEILEEPTYPAFRKVSIAQRLYARTVALANLGRPAEARAELEAYRAACAEVPEHWLIGTNPASTILELADQMAEGEVLWREGKGEEAYAVLRAAVAFEDSLVYDEPPGWMNPVRHALGALLLAGGEAQEALEVYVADLEDSPANAWSVLGKYQALTALGETSKAQAMAPQLALAWQLADVNPPASCYCGAPTE